MEDLIIFRLFLAFPLIGLLLPDTGTLFSPVKGYIPATHIIIEVTLLVSIMVCSAGIMYFKRKLSNELLNDKAAVIA